MFMRYRSEWEDLNGRVCVGYCADGGNKILHWKRHLKWRLQMKGNLTSLALMVTELLVLLFFHIVLIVTVVVLEMSL